MNQLQKIISKWVKKNLSGDMSFTYLFDKYSKKSILNLAGLIGALFLMFGISAFDGATNVVTLSEWMRPGMLVVFDSLFPAMDAIARNELAITWTMRISVFLSFLMVYFIFYAQLQIPSYEEKGKVIAIHRAADKASLFSSILSALGYLTIALAHLTKPLSQMTIPEIGKFITYLGIAIVLAYAIPQLVLELGKHIRKQHEDLLVDIDRKTKKTNTKVFGREIDRSRNNDVGEDEGDSLEDIIKSYKIPAAV